MAEVLGHGGLRSDTEERYAALKVRLKEADIGTPDSYDRYDRYGPLCMGP
eukprot:COSAG02_NODE_14902_length_1224_cov_2.284444_1_plen_50_part_00